MANQIFMRVNEVAEELGVSVPEADVYSGRLPLFFAHKYGAV